MLLCSSSWARKGQEINTFHKGRTEPVVSSHKTHDRISPYLIFILLVLFSVLLLFLLLLLWSSIMALVVWSDGLAHCIHWTDSTMGDSGVGVTVASWRVWWKSYKDKSLKDREVCIRASITVGQIFWGSRLCSLETNTALFARWFDQLPC